MKKKQYEILDKFFKDGRADKAEKKYSSHIKSLLKLYIELPEDISRFEALVKLDDMDDDSMLIIRLNSEQRYLEDLAEAYKMAYSKNPELPLLKEMTDMYIDLVNKYSK